jgi:hypothetical protein
MPATRRKTLVRKRTIKKAASEIITLRNTLLAQVRPTRMTGNRELMHELVIRIRQLDGILEARASRRND